MKIAYLVAAHTDPKQLRRLVSALTGDNCDFYIHIDKKSDQKPFEDATAVFHNVKFVDKRIADYWGGHSHLLTLDHLLEEALAKKYDRLVYVSGLDYPVWSNREMEEFYLDNPDKEIVCAFNLTSGDDEIAIQKISHYAWWDVRIKHEKLFNKVRRKLNDFLAYIPHPTSFEIEGKKWDVFWGSDWWSLTYDAAKYVYETYHKHKVMQKYFKFCFCPSELWVQTILANSDVYKDRITYTTDFHLEAVTPLQHIDYRGPMRVWKEADFDEIVNSGKMFIRKTTSTESEGLQDKIDARRARLEKKERIK